MWERFVGTAEALFMLCTLLIQAFARRIDNAGIQMWLAVTDGSRDCVLQGERRV